MFRSLLIGVAGVLLSGCAVKYGPADRQTLTFDEPQIGAINTAEVGDHMLRKGVLVEESVLSLKAMVDGFAYDIMPGEYPELGQNEGERFFQPSGVVRNPLADQYQSISVKADQPAQVCVVTVFAARSCYDADFDIVKRTSVGSASFQQTLIYSGRVGEKINIGYREFSNQTARPAFNNDVEYDLSTSREIGYKGALLEVLEANNSSIKYKVLRSFK